ncbi:beta strand repeat-containing protein [Frigoriglobus tundricola]|uniref:beta strand repeat-containing protein n=1 Tax=Frigoriglobus tundricola TaxID=2774151 RepID=UPI00148E93E5|nr:choice-of-anchor D domain-containing protein [Frigoriglobus tundricola]
MGQPLGATPQTVRFTFAPSVIGSESATFTILTSDGSATVTLSGAGVSPLTLVSPSLDFGPVPVGTTSPSSRSSSVIDQDPTDVYQSTVLGGANPADFSVSSVLVPGQPLPSLRFNFTPSVVGPESATFTFVTRDGSVTETVTGQGTSPLNLVSPSLDFGPVPVGTTSPSSRTSSVIDQDPTDVYQSTVLGGANPADFSVSSVLVPGQPLPSLRFNFTPSVVGPESATFTFVTRDGSVTETVTGQGTSPLNLVSPNLDFGSGTPGTTNPATRTAHLGNVDPNNVLESITEGGPNQGDFILLTSSSLGQVLPADQSLRFQFTPSTTGTESARFTFSTSDGSVTVYLTGNGTGVAQPISLSHSAISFGNVVEGVTSLAQATSLWDFKPNLQILNLTVTGPNTSDFTLVSPNPVPLNQTLPISVPGGASSLSVSFTFTPSTTGAESATCVIDTTAGELDLTLNGTGLSPLSLSKPSVNFGSVGVGAAANPLSVGVWNFGANVQLLGVVSTSPNAADFPLVSPNPLPATLPVAQAVGSATAPNGSSSLTLLFGFDPSTVGTETAVYTVETSEGNVQVTLTGTGVSTLSLAKPSLDFGSQTVGNPSVLLTSGLWNFGQNVQLLSVSSASPEAGDFVLVSPNPLPLNQTIPVATPVGTSGAPNGQTSMSLGFVFTPSGVGTETATYVIHTTAGDLTLALSGTGTAQVVAPTLSVSDASGIFNGSPYSASYILNGLTNGSLEGVTPSLAYYSGSSAVGSPLPGAPTAPGTYTVVASFAGSTDYAPTSASAVFTIGLATPSVSVSDLSDAFDGAPFVASASIAGVVPGVDDTPAASLEGVGLSLAYYSGASTTPLAGPPTSAGTYTVVASFAGSTDYAPTSASAVFTIGLATPSVSVSDLSDAFDGAPFVASASIAGVDDTPAASLEGVGLSLAYYSGASTTPLAGPPTSAGTYTVVASFVGSTDYAPTSASAVFTIGLATPSVSVSDLSDAFDGAPFVASASIAGVVPGVDDTPAASLEGVGLSLAYYSGASTTPLAGPPTSAGTYTVVASFAGSPDYAPDNTSATFTIRQATPVLSLTALGGTYTGSPIAATASIAGIVSGVDNTPGPSLEGVGLTLAYFSGSSASGSPLAGPPTGTGTYTVVASFAGSLDYLSDQTQTTFVISGQTPTLTVADAGGTYNGSSFPATYTLNGVASGSLEGVAPTLTYYAGSSATGTPLSAPATAGTYTVLATFPGSVDYLAAQAQTTFTISAAATTLTVTRASGTFTGSAFTATYTLNGTIGGLLEGVAPSLTYYLGSSATGTPLSAPTTVGTYTVLASFPGSTDYKSASAQATFSITQAAPTLTVTRAGGAYTGSAFVASYTLNGVANGTLEGTAASLTYYAGTTATGTPLAGAPTALGTYTVVALFPGTTDYKSASAKTRFTISQATPTLTVTRAGGAYTGSAFAASYTLNGVANGTLEGTAASLTYYAGTTATGTPLAGAPTTAGTYTVVAAFAGSTDYKATTAKTTFTIAQVTPTLTVTRAGGTYTGSAFAASYTLNGVANGTLEGTAASLTYYAGTTATGTPLAGAPTTAGTYTVVAAFAGSTDYKATTAKTTFTISKATPNLIASDAGGTYNSTAFSATYSLNGVIGGSLEGVTATLTYYAGTTGTGTPLAGAPTTAGTYTVVAAFAGSTDYSAVTAKATFTIGKATPAFQISSSQSISKGTVTTTFAGKIALGALLPTGTVTLVLNGVKQTVVIQADGTFSVNFTTKSLASGRYTLQYTYSGDTNFATASASETLTVV